MRVEAVYCFKAIVSGARDILNDADRISGKWNKDDKVSQTSLAACSKQTVYGLHYLSHRVRLQISAKKSGSGFWSILKHQLRKLINRERILMKDFLCTCLN